MIEEIYAAQLKATLKGFLEEQCSQKLIDTTEVRLNFLLHKDDLRAFLYNGSKHVQEVPMTDLVRHFMTNSSEDAEK